MLAMPSPPRLFYRRDAIGADVETGYLHDGLQSAIFRIDFY